MLYMQTEVRRGQINNMPDSNMIRILVVDDHFMVRMGLCASLNVEPDIRVVAEAGSGEEALRAYRQHQPTLILMDVRLPGMSGIEAAAAILSEFPNAHILMLSTHAGEEEIYRSLQTGAAGYILKSAVREQLLQAIRQVCSGERYIDPSVTSLLAARLSHRSLTSRELEVLRMVVKGLSNKEIAAALNIAEVTVKLHVSHVLEKLNVKDRTHAATEALKRGIIYS
jgi:DNA-binding NarL/FixJ family response regulator